MRLETVDAAETQPVGRVGAVAAGAGSPPVSQSETTLRRRKPVAEPARFGRRRTPNPADPPSHARPRRTPRRHRPWLIAALALAVAVALTGVLIAATDDSLRPKAVARDAAQETAQGKKTLPARHPRDVRERVVGPFLGDRVRAGRRRYLRQGRRGAHQEGQRAARRVPRGRPRETGRVAPAPRGGARQGGRGRGDRALPPPMRSTRRSGTWAVALQNEGALGEVVPTEAPAAPTGDEQGGVTRTNTAARRRTARPTGTKRTRA